MTLKVTQGYRNCCCSWAIYNVALVVCSNDTILHRFLKINIFVVHENVCDLEKSFVFKKAVDITSHVRIVIQV